MKVTTPNRQGQVVIPAQIRKKLNINENTFLKIFTKDKIIYLEILDINNSIEESNLSFSKKNEQTNYLNASDQDIEKATIKDIGEDFLSEKELNYYLNLKK